MVEIRVGSVYFVVGYNSCVFLIVLFSLIAFVLIAIQVTANPILEFSDYADTIQFRFKSKEYAEEFAELNSGKFSKK